MGDKEKTADGRIQRGDASALSKEGLGPGPPTSGSPRASLWGSQMEGVWTLRTVSRWPGRVALSTGLALEAGSPLAWE